MVVRTILSSVTRTAFADEIRRLSMNPKDKHSARMGLSPMAEYFCTTPKSFLRIAEDIYNSDSPPAEASSQGHVHEGFLYKFQGHIGISMSVDDSGGGRSRSIEACPAVRSQVLDVTRWAATEFCPGNFANPRWLLVVRHRGRSRQV